MVAHEVAPVPMPCHPLPGGDLCVSCKSPSGESGRNSLPGRSVTLSLEANQPWPSGAVQGWGGKPLYLRLLKCSLNAMGPGVIRVHLFWLILPRALLGYGWSVESLFCRWREHGDSSEGSAPAPPRSGSQA